MEPVSSDSLSDSSADSFRSDPSSLSFESGTDGGSVFSLSSDDGDLDTDEAFVAARDRRERIQYLIAHLETFGDARLELKNKTIRCCRELVVDSRLVTSSDPDEPIRIDDELDVDEGTLIGLLAGAEDAHIPTELLVDYYAFFEHLGLIRHMAIVCDLAESIDLEVLSLVSVFVKCFERYEHEEEDEDVDTFESALTLALFNRFIAERHVIVNTDNREMRPIRVALQRKILYGRLMKAKHRAVRKHPVFLGVARMPPRGNWRTLLRSTLRRLHSENRLHNLKLRACDDSPIDTHCAVLILQSNFFFRCIFRFKGLEFQEMKRNREVNIESKILNAEMLSTLLEHIYTGSLRSLDLRKCLLLLRHAEMFHEQHLQASLLQRIMAITQVVLERNVDEFIHELLRFGYLIQTEVTRRKLVEFWTSLNTPTGESMSEENILKALRKSEKGVFEDRVSRVIDDNQFLRRRLAHVENELRALKKIVFQLASRTVPSKRLRRRILRALAGTELDSVEEGRLSTGFELSDSEEDEGESPKPPPGDRKSPTDRKNRSRRRRGRPKRDPKHYSF